MAEPKTAADRFDEGIGLYNSGKYEEAITAFDQVLKIDQKDAAAWINKGVALKKLGKYEEEIAAYDEALKIDPKRATAWNNKGSALDSLRKYEDAIAAYDEALNINPKYVLAWNNKGHALKKLEKYENAIAAYEESLKLDPKDPLTWINKGLALQELKILDSALDCYDTALKLDPQQKSANSFKEVLIKQQEALRSIKLEVMAEPKTADDWNNKGNGLYDSGKYEEAIAAYDQALKIDEKCVIAWNNKGNSLNKLGKYEEGIAAYDEALKINQKDAAAWTNKGSTLDTLGKYEEAIAAYDEALKIDPTKANAWYNKGNALDKLLKYEDAIAAYDEALKINPKYVLAWNNKGHALRKLGKYENAIVAYEESLKLDPKEPLTWINKGHAFQELKHLDSALDCCDAALKLDPQYKLANSIKTILLGSKKYAIALCDYGLSLYNLKRYEEAIASYDEAVNIDPKYANAWYNKGNALNNLGKYEDAIVVFDEALKINPKYVDPWNSKGVSLKNLKNFDSALDCFDTALKLDPQHNLANSNKSELLELMKQQKPTGNVKDAVNQDPNPAPIKKGTSLTSAEDKLKEKVEKRQRSQLAQSAPYKKGDLLDDSYLKSKFEESELRLIGKGSFGKVFSASKKEGGEKIALKVIETKSSDSINEAVNELLNLAIIKGHPNIITYQNFRINPVVLEDRSFIHQLFLDMPLADCSLENLLQNEIGFPEEEAVFSLHQISLGLQHAHERKIAHLDLKPENILLIGGKIMIADWGGSLRLKSSSSTTVKEEISYTRGYEAPELCEKSYGDKDKYNFYVCDIYSLAMIVFRLCGISFEVLKGIPKTMKKWHDQFLKEEILQELEKTYSKELLGLLRGMSAFDPEQRTSLKEIFSYAESGVY